VDTLRLREAMGADTHLPREVLTHRPLEDTQEDMARPLAVDTARPLVVDMERHLAGMEHLPAVDMHLPQGDTEGMDLPQEQDL
jgi:hypothetical protein